MQQVSDAMETAWRVLTAFTNHRHPDQADVEKLQSLAGPRAVGMDMDEPACEVIHQALKERAKVRANGSR